MEPPAIMAHDPIPVTVASVPVTMHWIPVEAALPIAWARGRRRKSPCLFSDPVLVWPGGETLLSEHVVTCYYPGEGFRPILAPPFRRAVTHWMPLPPGPREP
jgi:hypothetical protein